MTPTQTFTFCSTLQSFRPSCTTGRFDFLCRSNKWFYICVSVGLCVTPSFTRGHRAARHFKLGSPDSADLSQQYNTIILSKSDHAPAAAGLQLGAHYRHTQTHTHVSKHTPKHIHTGTQYIKRRTHSVADTLHAHLKHFCINYTLTDRTD